MYIFPFLTIETTHRITVASGKTYLLRIISAVLNADMYLSIADHNMTVVGMDGSYVKPVTTNYIMLSPGQTIDVLVTADQSVGRYYIATHQYSSDSLTVVNYDHMNATAIIEYTGNYTMTDPLYPFATLPGYKDNAAALEFTDKIRSLANEEYPVSVPQNVSRRMFVVVSMGVFLCPNSSCGGIYGDRLATSMNNFSWLNPSTTDILKAYYWYV